MVAGKVVDAFVAQNNALFGGLPTHVKGTQHVYGNWWTSAHRAVEAPRPR